MADRCKISLLQTVAADYPFIMATTRSSSINGCYSRLSSQNNIFSPFQRWSMTAGSYFSTSLLNPVGYSQSMQVHQLAWLRGPHPLMNFTTSASAQELYSSDIIERTPADGILHTKLINSSAPLSNTLNKIWTGTYPNRTGGDIVFSGLPNANQCRCALNLQYGRVYHSPAASGLIYPINSFGVPAVYTLDGINYSPCGTDPASSAFGIVFASASSFYGALQQAYNKPLCYMAEFNQVSGTKSYIYTHDGGFNWGWANNPSNYGHYNSCFDWDEAGQRFVATFNYRVYTATSLAGPWTDKGQVYDQSNNLLANTNGIFIWNGTIYCGYSTSYGNYKIYSLDIDSSPVRATTVFTCVTPSLHTLWRLGPTEAYMVGSPFSTPKRATYSDDGGANWAEYTTTNAAAMPFPGVTVTSSTTNVSSALSIVDGFSVFS